jgi:hypothetical protein
MGRLKTICGEIGLDFSGLLLEVFHGSRFSPS